MTWEIHVNLGTPAKPFLRIVTADPLPSGVPQVLVLLRPSKAPRKRRRLEKIFEAHPSERGRLIPPRQAGWRTLRGVRDVEWWVCGPLSWGGPVYQDVLATISSSPSARYGMRLSRRLVVVECREGRDVELAPPDPAPIEEEEDIEP